MSPDVLGALETPALLLDLGVLRTNIEEMAARARSIGVALRPHAKTHKSPTIAALQLDHGAAGLTVGTVEEAERLVDAGIDDLLLTVPPVGDSRVRRLVMLARRSRVRVALDSVEAVLALDEACQECGEEVGFLWEIDCGVGRFGTSPGEESVMQILKATNSTRRATFDGLLAFGGHAYAATSAAGIRAAATDERSAVARTAEQLRAHGLGVRVTSVGTTPTSHYMVSGAGITEIRPGNYVFHDATQVAMGVVGVDRCALSVVATVVSRPTRDRLILDAGSKALGADRLSPLTTGFGLVAAHPELVVERLYEEQAVVAVVDSCSLGVGDRVQVIPNHACTTANLHADYLVVDSGSVVDVWPVAARGWGRSLAPTRQGAWSA